MIAFATVGVLGFVHAGDTTAAPSPAVDRMFNVPLALVGTTGAVPTAAVVDNRGGFLVVGSTVAGDGCTLSALSRGGGSATYLGRTPGGSDCAVASFAWSQGSDGLALVTQGPAGYVDGTSSDRGASFTWHETAALGVPKALAADSSPSVPSTDLFLVVQSLQTGEPRIAISSDGGRTFALGSRLINPADIPAADWQTPSPAPAVGDLVARRTSTGLRLYSVIETSGPIATPSGSAPAKTRTLSRVYEAVGTVSAATLTHPEPSVTWRDIPLYNAPAGTSLDPRGASIALDGAGRVYAAFTDGRHLYVQAAGAGVGRNPAAVPVIVDAVAAGMPSGGSGAFSPAIAAGGDGRVDVAWFEAGATASSEPSARASASSTATVFMAQTMDRGRSWHAYPVSAVQQSGPAGSVQLAVNGATGVAEIAYAGAIPMSGMPVLYATRQCTGLSVTTGAPVSNDCATSRSAPSVLPGTVCSGPQVRNRAFDAVHNGVNIVPLDVYTAGFSTVDASTEVVTITVGRIDKALPAGITEAVWRVTWEQGTREYYAQAAMLARSTRYSVGLMNLDGTPGPGSAVRGAMRTVAGGSSTGAITVDIPLAAVGRPVAGTQMTNIVAASLAVFKGSIATPQLVDRAPDGSAGAVFSVAQACAPAAVVPEIPSAALLPLVGGVAALVVTLMRRRQADRRAHG